MGLRDQPARPGLTSACSLSHSDTSCRNAASSSVSSKSIAASTHKEPARKGDHRGGRPICLRWRWIAERELTAHVAFPRAKLQSLVAMPPELVAVRNLLVWVEPRSPRDG